MRVGPAGVALIKEFEGFPHGGHPYQDMVGVWTIGYGHTEGVGANTPRISEQQASQLLARDLDNKYAPAVARLGVPLSQNQFDALTSFVYNCGPGAIGDTKVGRALRTRRYRDAADLLLEWDKAGGHPVPGLTRRRRAERALFLTEDDPFEGYSPNERRWLREYDKLVREDRDIDRRRSLRAAMTRQRKRIWRLAQPAEKGGDGKGWDHEQRRDRYASLLARTR
jgi:lysozyme